MVLVTSSARRTLAIVLLLAAVLPAPILAAGDDRAVAGRGPFRVYVALLAAVDDADRGFMEYFESNGIPVEFIIRSAGNDPARLDDFAGEIHATRPDLVYVRGTTVATRIAGTIDDAAATARLAEFPIVFNIVADPVGARLVHALERPGRNLTGAAFLVPLPIQINTIEKVKPLKRLAVLYNPAEVNSVLVYEDLVRLGAERGFTVIDGRMPLHDGRPRVADVEPTIVRLAEQRPDFIYMPADTFLRVNSHIAGEAMVRHGVPSFSAFEGPIREGGAFMGIVSRYYNVGRLAAFKASQILTQGKRPEDIPVETLRRFSLLFNIRTALAINQYPPMEMLKYAEIVGRQ